MTLKRWAFENIYAHYGRARSDFDRRAYFARREDRRINIGAGRNVLPGWLNIDIKPRPGAVWLDAGRPWPIADDVFDAALCEHMIEHVPKPLGRFILGETLRTLRPGGWLRVVTPDLRRFASHIVGEGDPADDEYLAFLRKFHGQDSLNWCDAINIVFREYGHAYIWTADELGDELRRAGFAELKLGRAAHWMQPVFEDAEGHPRMLQREAGVDGVRIDALEAFAIEAMKPR